MVNKYYGGMKSSFYCVLKSVSGMYGYPSLVQVPGGREELDVSERGWEEKKGKERAGEGYVMDA